MRAYLVLEKTGSEPTTITDFENFIRNTFLIRPQGEAAYSEFKLARQQKRTPREYLLHLKSLAALSNGDAEAGDISDEMIFFKFKTTLWEVKHLTPYRCLLKLSKVMEYFRKRALMPLLQLEWKIINVLLMDMFFLSWFLLVLSLLVRFVTVQKQLQLNFRTWLLLWLDALWKTFVIFLLNMLFLWLA